MRAGATGSVRKWRTSRRQRSRFSKSARKAGVKIGEVTLGLASHARALSAILKTSEVRLPRGVQKGIRLNSGTTP